MAATKNLHHSASAPVLSSLLTSTAGQASSSSGGSAADQCLAMKQKLLDQVEKLGPNLPPNTLDELIDELGGPENVSEVRGGVGWGNTLTFNIDSTFSLQSSKSTFFQYFKEKRISEVARLIV